MRSHSYWPQNYSRVVFGCHVGGSDVISFSRTISPAKTTKTTNPRDGFGGKWQTSSRKKNTTCFYDARLSGVQYSTKLFAEKCGYLLARKVGFGCFCFASSGARYPRLVFHAPPRVLYSEEEKKSWKSTKLSKQREQRSRRGKREIYFLNRDFPLNF